MQHIKGYTILLPPKGWSAANMNVIGQQKMNMVLTKYSQTVCLSSIISLTTHNDQQSYSSIKCQ
jgi:hypothetical protein